MIENKVIFSGQIKALTEKNIKSNDLGTFLTAWIDQRVPSRMPNGDIDRTRYVTGYQIVVKDPKIVKTILDLDKNRNGVEPRSAWVTITGSKGDYIIKSKIPNGKDTFVPQVEVFDLEVL
jgi:hypothetical protein